MEVCYNYLSAKDGDSVAIGSRLVAILAKQAGTYSITKYGNLVADNYPLVPGYNKVNLFFNSGTGCAVNVKGSDVLLLV